MKKHKRKYTKKIKTATIKDHNSFICSAKLPFYKNKQLAYSAGFDEGLQEGIRQSKEESKKIRDSSISERINSSNELLRNAGQFQEGITKLLMSINNQL